MEIVSGGGHVRDSCNPLCVATLPEGRRAVALAAHLDRAGKIKVKVTCLYLKPQFIRRWNRGLKRKEKTITVPVAVTLRQSLAEALP